MLPSLPTARTSHPWSHARHANGNHPVASIPVAVVGLALSAILPTSRATRCEKRYRERANQEPTPSVSFPPVLLAPPPLPRIRASGLVLIPPRFRTAYSQTSARLPRPGRGGLLSVSICKWHICGSCYHNVFDGPSTTYGVGKYYIRPNVLSNLTCCNMLQPDSLATSTFYGLSAPVPYA